MSLLKRLEGVFIGPKPVFEALAEKPVWVDVLVIVLVVIIAHSLLVYPYMQKDQLELRRDNVKLQERMGKDAFDRMIKNLENPSTASRLAQVFVTTPLFAFAALLLQALALLLMARLFSSRGGYVHVLAALVHASLVDKLLGNAVRGALAMTRQSFIQTSTSLVLLFPKLEVMSTAYAVLSQVDFFQLWMFGILAFGISAIFKIDLKRSLFLTFGLWFLKAVANILVQVLGISLLR